MLEEMKLKDVLSLVNALSGIEKNTSKSNSDFWVIGRAYFIRTVTMHLIGNLKEINDSELILENAVWVAVSGRFNNALKNGELDEVEPFVKDVAVNRRALVDATEWIQPIPKEVI